MNIYFIALILFFVTVVFVTIARKVGRFKFLDKQLKLGKRGIALTAAESKSEPYSPRKYESLVFLILGLSTLKIAYHVSKYLFLCFLYGLSRVHSEGLHFTDMSNGHPWILSNGDQIDHNLHPLLFVICAAVWVFPTFAVFVLGRRLLPKRNALGARRGGYSDVQECLTQKPMERRSLFEKGRPFRTGGLLFLTYWVLAMVFFFVFAHWIGRMVLVLMPGTSIILYIVYIRSRGRHFVSMMIETPCSQCGQVPLRYETPRDENGRHHLLICDKCRIEWDLGSI